MQTNKIHLHSFANELGSAWRRGAGLTAVACLTVATVVYAEAIRFDFTSSHMPSRGVAGGLVFAAERCVTPPRIDGSADDPAWRNLPVMSEFGIAEPATRARFCYDDTALYILVECAGAPGVAPQGKPHPRDGIKQDEDQIHICVAPMLEHGAEYILRLNVAGAVSDSKDGDERWDGAWLQAVRQEGNDWSAEFALPFADFGLKAPPPRLGFNIGRKGPKVQIRSFCNAKHYSASASALILKGVSAAAPVTSPSGATKSVAEVCEGGASLDVRLDRAYARPQDRWIDALVTLTPRRPLGETRLQAKLLDVGGERVLETASIVPATDYGRVSVDLRKHNLDRAELRIEYVEGDQRSGMARIFLSVQPAAPLTAGLRIPVPLDVPTNAGLLKAWPIAVGIPFPAGALWDVGGLRMVNRDGREIPCQKEVVGLWSEEGAIQWVRFDALVNSAEGCYVDVAAPAVGPSPALTITERDGRLSIDTGVSRYVLGKGASPVEEIWMGNDRVASCAGARGLYVVDQEGRFASASSDGALMEIESRGPVAASVRLEGFYRTAQGEPLARHITRVEVFAGQPFADITHTLILTRDTNKTWFKEVGWEWGVVPGNGPRGVFNTARTEPGMTIVAPLAKGTSAWMLQDRHMRFGADTNHYLVSVNGRTLAEGQECGDWALLAGSGGGLLVDCREVARQHPKEFELAPDRFVLKLFSNRAGEELDFRAAALARKWNLKGAAAAEVGRMSNDAAGWAKTHELRLAPLPAANAEAAAARLSALHGTPVNAGADPAWIWKSGAMGPLYPRDPVRFADAERVIDGVFQLWGSRGHERGHYGFVDYFAGPTYGSGPSEDERFKYTYGLRSKVWLVYARSGDRAVRAFAEGTNKRYLDNYITHWEASGRERGLWTSGPNEKTKFPFYWGERRDYSITSSTDLNQFIWLYRLTGYRRAKDAIHAFAEGLKRSWKPGQHLNPREIMVFRELTQCYGFTWDPALRALAEDTFDAFSDPETELLLSKNRQYGSTTYKTSTDLRGLIEGWQLFGLPKYHETAVRLARFWWSEAVGTLPVSYNNPWGFAGSFLYDETHDPAIAAALDFGLRRIPTHPATGYGASYVTAAFEGIPYAMSVVARQPGGPAAPWVAYRGYGFPSSVVAKKGRTDVLDWTLRLPGRKFDPADDVRARFTLRALDISDWTGHDLYTVVQRSHGASSVRVPKDAPPGAYELIPEAKEDVFVVAGSALPMVLHAEGYWMLPELAPPCRVYFNLPTNAADAQLFFEGKARLFDPAGRPFADPAGARGWVDLPDKQPGLWCFEPAENRLVRARNFPPFFAFGNPAFYFEPPIEWAREAPERGAPVTQTNSIFVAGASAGDVNRALFLSGKKTLTFPAGSLHGSGDGGQFVPRRQGTVEFFFKPSWSTLDLGPGNVSIDLAHVLTDTNSTWNLVHRIDPEGVNLNLCPRDPSHSLFGSMYLSDPGKSWLRVWLTETLFERGQWVHIAWVWGPKRTLGPHRNKLDLMTMRIFVNGQGRAWTIFREAGEAALPLGLPRSLVLGPLKGAAIDELRVSDVQRYTENFTPPARDRELAADAHTRALFRFNGDLKGLSHGVGGELVGKLEE